MEVLSISGLSAGRKCTEIINKCYREVFKGRGILILRNPYDAVLSKLNYLYGGHRGASSIQQFERLEIFHVSGLQERFLFREDWEEFVKVEMADWVSLALSWSLTGEGNEENLVGFENI